MDSDKIYNLFFGAVGAAVAVYGLVMLIQALLFRINGEQTIGTVTGSHTDKRGRYVHTVKYNAGGKDVTAEDSAGYSQAFPTGTEKPIIYKKSVPERFRFTDENRMSMTVFGILAVLGVLMALRFWLA